MTTDEFAGMTPADEARARAYQENQVAIQQKREAAARALLPASSAPADAVKAAWKPVEQARDAQKAQAATGGQSNATRPGGGVL